MQIKLKTVLLFFIFFLPVFSFEGSITGFVEWNTDQVITGDVTVEVGATLTIKKGVTVSIVYSDLNPTDEVGDISFIVNGKIIIEGTADSVVTFTPSSISKLQNQWQGIIINQGIQDNSKINYCIVEGTNRGIEINANKAHVSNTIVRNCENTGISITATNDTVSNCIVQNVSFYGLHATGSNYQINNVLSTDNQYGIYLSNTNGSTISQIAAFNNEKYGIYIEDHSGTIEGVVTAFNSEDGLVIGNGSGDIQNANISQGDRNGLLIDGTFSGKIDSSYVTENKQHGIHVSSTSTATISNLKIADNGNENTFEIFNEDGTVNYLRNNISNSTYSNYKVIVKGGVPVFNNNNFNINGTYKRSFNYSDNIINAQYSHDSSFSGEGEFITARYRKSQKVLVLSQHIQNLTLKTRSKIVSFYDSKDYTYREGAESSEAGHRIITNNDSSNWQYHTLPNNGYENFTLAPPVTGELVLSDNIGDTVCIDMMAKGYRYYHPYDPYYPYRQRTVTWRVGVIDSLYANYYFDDEEQVRELKSNSEEIDMTNNWWGTTVDVQNLIGQGTGNNINWGSILTSENSSAGISNNLPIVNAGNDFSDYTQKIVTLDGSGSSDPEDEDLVYFWYGSPNNPSLVTLSDNFSNSAQQTSFVASLGGDYTFYLCVSDGKFISVTDSVNVTLIQNTDPQIVINIPDVTVQEDQSDLIGYVDLNYVFNDNEDGSALTFSISENSNPNIVAVEINSDSALNILFIPDSNGIATISVQAEDEFGATVTDEFIITINGVNDAPRITSSAPDSAIEDIEYKYLPAAIDPEGDNFNWTLSNEPNGMTIDPATGEIAWIPLEGVLTSGEVTLTVTDDGTPTLFSTEVFTITVTPVNDAPAITTTAPNNAIEDIEYIYLPAATDTEGDNYNWSLSNEPTGMTIDSATGEITWTPLEGVLTSGEVTLTVTDDGTPAESSTEIFTITVTPVNDAPIISSTAPTSAMEDIVYSYKPTAENVEGDIYNWSLSNEPTGMTIDPATGEITWTPLEGVLTSGEVTLIVTDDGTPVESSTELFTITVQSVNDTPSVIEIEDQMVNAGTLFELDLSTHFIDSDNGDTISLMATLENDSPLPTWLVLNQTFLIGTPSSTDADSITVKVTGSDKVGASVFTLFTLTINKPVSVIYLKDIPNILKSTFNFAPNPAEQKHTNLAISLPEKRSGTGTLFIYDETMNCIFEKEIDESLVKYNWDLKSKYMRRISRGTYAVFFKYKDGQGNSYMLKKMLGVKE